MSETVSVPGDMPDAEFREAVEAFGTWVADYRQKVGSLPVMARVAPGRVRDALPPEAPARGEAAAAWLRDLDNIVVPALTHWNHPGFMAYFGITGSGPGVLGELVSSVLNVNGMLWKTSPALTELEQVVVGWYTRALGLPPDWFGMLTDTASTSTLVALAAAREATGLGIREHGLAGSPPLTLYCSAEAHASVDKAALVLGTGLEGIRRIPSDNRFRMRVDELEAAIERDRAAGRHPFAVVATVGTTSSTSVDPVSQISDVCRKFGLWLHVDAAYAGSAAIAPEFRWALDGCDRADSLVANPHKWLFTPVDCSVLTTPRPDVFKRAFSLVPEYLTTDARDVTDLMDYSFQLGRRFRALKLWFVLRYFGIEGAAARIREHVRMAHEFARWLEARREVEILAPVNFSVVCFRIHPAGVDDEADLERINTALLRKVNDSGRAFLSHTKLKGRYCLRLAVGNLGTTIENLRTVFALVAQEAPAEARP